MLTKLLDFKPLTPLTGENDEWTDVGDRSGYPHWQNKRCSSVFKNADGSCYDIDGKVFWEWQRNGDGEAVKTYYTGHGCSVPVTFPYTPPKEPIYEYRYSDATPSAPLQNEQGLL
jgi:hypothetical protein